LHIAEHQWVRFSKKLSDAEKTGLELSQKVKTTSIEALRKLPADSVWKLASTLPYGTFAPVIDGYVLPDDMGSIFKNKNHNDVALIAGWVTGDAALTGQPKSASEYKAWVKETYKDKESQFLKAFPAATDRRSFAIAKQIGQPELCRLCRSCVGIAQHQQQLSISVQLRTHR
jgi:para-nitrobenzyl esterase